MNARPTSWPNQEADALLGIVPDRVISRLFSVDHRTVSYRRARLGVAPAPYMTQVRIRAMSSPDLGRVPDAVLADRLGIDRKTVSTARKAKGIPPCRAHVGRFHWLREAIVAWLTEHDVSATTREIADAVEAPIENVRWHLNVAESHGVVVCLDRGEMGESGTWVIA